MKAVESTSHKIMARETARQWRNQQTGSVVFTNGVFDLVHPGHVDLLEQARALGDVLIVAINDDESARVGFGVPEVSVAGPIGNDASLGQQCCHRPGDPPVEVTEGFSLRQAVPPFVRRP